MESIKTRSYKAIAAFMLAVAMAFSLGLGASQAWAEDTTVTVGTNTTSPTNQAPLQNAWVYGITQQIYKASEIGESGQIKSIGFDINAAATKYAMSNLKISLGYKSTDTFADRNDWVAASDLTEVYNGTPASDLFWSTGWNTIQFDTPFDYNVDNGNLVVAVTVATTEYDGQLRFNTTSVSNSVVTLGSDSQPDCSDKTPILRNTRPNIQLTFAGEESSDPAGTTVEIGTGTGETNGAPLNNDWTYGLTQMIYKADEINNSGDIESIAFNVTTPNDSAYDMTSLKVYMGTTDASKFDRTARFLGLVGDELTLVYQATPGTSFATSTGWQTIQLDTPFSYNTADGNLVIACAVESTGYKTNPKFAYTVSSDMISQRASLNNAQAADVTVPYLNGTSWNRETSSLFRPNVQLTFAAEQQQVEKPEITLFEIQDPDETWYPDYASSANQPASGGTYAWYFDNEDDDTVDFSEVEDADFTAQSKSGDGDWEDSSEASAKVVIDSEYGLNIVYLENVPDNTEQVAKQWRVVYSGTSPDCPAITQAAAEPVSLEWDADCFTYDGATITGLTERGKAVLKEDPAMIMPNEAPDGTTITAIGPGAAGKGTFTFTEEGEGSAFDRTYTPTSVQLPASLEEIGNFAFCEVTETTSTPWRYKGLTTIDFPETLQKIGLTAFQNVPLDKIVLPDSVVELGQGAFTGNEKIPAPKLSELTISKNLKNIPQAAFTTRQVDDIVVPEGVETIGRTAFSGSLATTVSLPSTLKTIDRQAFNNHHFETVEIPASVETIEQTAFRIVVGDYAGSGHTITNLVLNEGLKTIGQNAFQDACALESVSIPTTLTALHSTAFAGNTNANRDDDKVVLTSSKYAQIKKSEAPYNVTGFVTDGTGHIVVGDLSSATMAEVEDQGATGEAIEPKPEVTFDGQALVEDTDFTFSYDANTEAGTATITATGKGEAGTFINTLSGSFEITEAAAAKPENVWMGIAQGVEDTQPAAGGTFAWEAILADYGFMEDFFESLEAADFTLQTKAPADSEWTDVEDAELALEATEEEDVVAITATIADNETEEAIEWRVVYKHSDPSIQIMDSITITQEAAEPASLEWDADCFTYDGATITGLTERGKAVLKEDPAMVMPNESPDGETITAIGPGVFSTQSPGDKTGTFGFKEGDDWYLPETVTLPSGLVSIGNNAFASPQNMAGEVGLTAIEFPATLTTIGNNAFNWARLTEVVVPDSVTSLGQGAFMTIPAAPVKITSATLPSGLTAIPQNLFNNQSLESIEIPEGVTSIGNNAFNGQQCESITIPANVATIGTSAFSQAGKTSTLTSLTLNDVVTSIGNNAFNNCSVAQVEIPDTLTTLHNNAFVNANGGESKVVLVSSKYAQIKKSEAPYNVNAFVTSGNGHIVVGDLSSATMAEVEDQEATGEAIEPKPEVTFDGQALVEDTDFTFSYDANTEAGTATITATGKGEAGTFINTLSGSFEITEAAADPEITAIEFDKTEYSAGNAAFTVTLTGTALDQLQASDFKLEYYEYGWMDYNYPVQAIAVTPNDDGTSATVTFEVSPSNAKYRFTAKNYVAASVENNPQELTLKQAAYTNVTVDPTELEAEGGAVTFTVEGTNLDLAQVSDFKLFERVTTEYGSYDTNSNLTPTLTPSDDGTSLAVVFQVPANETDADKPYSLRVVKPGSSQWNPTYYTNTELPGARTEITVKAPAPTKPENVWMGIAQGVEATQPAAGGTFAWEAIKADYGFEGDFFESLEAADFTLQTKAPADSEWTDVEDAELALEATDEEDVVAITATIADNETEEAIEWRVVYKHSDPSIQIMDSITITQEAPAPAKPRLSYITVDTYVFGSGENQPAAGGIYAWEVSPHWADGALFSNLETADFTLQKKTGDDWADATEGSIRFMDGTSTFGYPIGYIAATGIPDNTGTEPIQWRIAYSGELAYNTSVITQAAPVDKSALEQAINDATAAPEGVETSEDGKDLTPGTQYTTPAEKKALDDAKAAAQEVFDNPDATQAEVDEATQALNDAIAAYNEAKKTAESDKTPLEEAIQAAQNAQNGVAESEDGKDVPTNKKYTTPAEKKALDDAIAAAQEVLDDPEATQNEIDEAAAAVKAAQDAYNDAKKDGKLAELIAIQAWVDDPQPAADGEYCWFMMAKDDIELIDYITPEDFELQKKDDEGNWVADDSNIELTIEEDDSGDPTCAMVYAAIPDNDEYVEKEWRVVYKPQAKESDSITQSAKEVDKTALNQAIADATTDKDETPVSADGKDQKPGTQYVDQATQDALNDAIAAAQAVADDPEATQDEVDAAKEAMDAAKQAFDDAKQTAAADKAPLQEAVEAAKADNDATPDNSDDANQKPGTETAPAAAKKAVDDAIAAAQEVLDNPEATQNEIDAAKKAVDDAKQALDDAKKPVATDKTALNNNIKAAQDTQKNIKTSSDGKDVDPKDKYVTPNEKKDLDNAIAAAKAVADNPDATQKQIDDAAAAVKAAQDKYDKAKKPGKKAAPVTTKTAIKSATAPAQKYTGKALKPAVTVKDANGKTVPASAYTVTYANNTNPGTATATVKAKADSKYTGSAKATFKITAAEQGVYWLVNKKTGENLYTTAIKEVNTLSKVKKTWTNKGLMWYAPTVGEPIYRLYNPKTGDHHFTKSANEVRVLTKVRKTWKADFDGKPIFYSGGPKKIWRQYSESRWKANKPGTHKFTTYNAKLSGWKNEGALIDALRYGKVNGVK